MSSDYKTKYLELRAKFLESTNMAYRAGYESGLKDGTKDLQIQQLQQQVADGQAQQQAMAAGAAGGIPGSEGQDPNQDPNQEGQPLATNVDPLTSSPNPQQVSYGDQGANNPEYQNQVGGDLDSAIEELSGMVSKGQKPSVVDLRKSLDKVMDIRSKNKAVYEMKKSNSNKSDLAKKVDSILDKWENEKSADDFEKMVRSKGIDLK